MENKKVSKITAKADARRKKQLAQMEKNLRPLLLSVILSICFTCAGTYALIKIVPWGFHGLQNSVLEAVKWYRDAELLAEDVLHERTLEVHVNLTQNEFKDRYILKSPVIFPGKSLQSGQYEQIFGVISGGQHGQVEVVVGNPTIKEEQYNSTLREFLKYEYKGSIQHDVSAASSNSIKNATCRNIRWEGYIDSATDVLRACGLDQTALRLVGKSVPRAHASSKPIVPDLGGPLQLLLARNNSGPPFRQAPQLWVEVLQGQLHWVLFHPQSLPAIGYSTSENLAEWMKTVYPTLTSREAPLVATQEAGQIVYIPEGWFYAYSSTSLLTIAIAQGAPFEQVGSPYNCLQEGRRRRAIGDLQGAQEILDVGIQKSTRTATSKVLAYLNSLSGRADMMGPIGDGRGLVPFFLYLELGNAFNALGQVAKAEVAYRDAISSNHRFAPSYVRYLTAVMAGLEEVFRAEWQKLHPRSAKPCSETSLRNAAKEATGKINAAIVLARTSGALTPQLLEMQEKAQNELLAPHDSSGHYCHAQLWERHLTRQAEPGERDEL